MYVVDLSQHDFIKVSGPEAVPFLQGQVSCDMNQLTADNSLRGALCNLKGRVIADFRLLKAGEDCLLQTAAGMGGRILDTLSKYAVFSKVTVEPDQSLCAVLGVLGENAGQRLQQRFDRIPRQPDDIVRGAGAILIRVAGEVERYELWCDDRALLDSLLQTDDFARAAAWEDWLQEDFLAGIIHVNDALTERYTPQLLNYDIAGVIDFKKGCYTGQEVVARMFYRGRAKKRMYLVGTTRPLDGTDKLVQHDGDKQQEAEILAIANGRLHPDRHLLLAVLNSEGVENGAALSVAGRETQLQVLSLPYFPG